MLLTPIASPARPRRYDRADRASHLGEPRTGETDRVEVAHESPASGPLPWRRRPASRARDRRRRAGPPERRRAAYREPWRAPDSRRALDDGDPDGSPVQPPLRGAVRARRGLSAYSDACRGASGRVPGRPDLRDPAPPGGQVPQRQGDDVGRRRGLAPAVDPTVPV